MFGRLKPGPYGAVAKLIVEGEHFVINRKPNPEQSGGEVEYAAVREGVRVRVLPALGAYGITATEYVE